MQTDFLKRISLIKKKHNEIAEMTGENFNVFDVLDIKTCEESHSRFIFHLLDSRTSHDKANLFLKLFLKTIEKDIEIKEGEFPLECAKAEREVSVDNGRVDIVISSAGKEIFIENKVWAQDQDKQLERYHKNNPFKLLYLTLDGRDASDESKGSLEKDRDYFCISYEHHILNWLMECHKESVNFPLLRETIKQYIFLIRELTNQSRSVEMKDEIVDLIVKDKDTVEVAFEMRNMIYHIRKKIIDTKLIPALENIAAERKLKFKSKFYVDSYKGCSFVIEDSAFVAFEFQGSHGAYSKLIYGFTKSSNNLAGFAEFCNEKRKQDSKYKCSDGGWPLFRYAEKYANWDAKIMAALSGDDKGLIEFFEKSLDEMLEIYDDFKCQLNQK
jgi:hypothetical protein